MALGLVYQFLYPAVPARWSTKIVNLRILVLHDTGGSNLSGSSQRCNTTELDGYFGILVTLELLDTEPANQYSNLPRSHVNGLVIISRYVKTEYKPDGMDNGTLTILTL